MRFNITGILIHKDDCSKIENNYPHLIPNINLEAPLVSDDRVMGYSHAAKRKSIFEATNFFA